MEIKFEPPVPERSYPILLNLNAGDLFRVQGDESVYMKLRDPVGVNPGQAACVDLATGSFWELGEETVVVKLEGTLTVRPVY